MKLRWLFLILAGLGAPLCASEPIPPQQGYGFSNLVKQPHVQAELFAQLDTTAIKQTGHFIPAKPFLVALHLKMDPGWHTYWINPGDSGIATKITWTLPPGFTAGPIQWPVPEIHSAGPLTTYGYEGDVYLLTTITPPADPKQWPQRVEIKAVAKWLVCQEECIPGKAELAVNVDEGWIRAGLDVDKAIGIFFNRALARLPAKNTDWHVTSNYYQERLQINFVTSHGESLTLPPKGVRFFPEQGNVLTCQEQGPTVALPNQAGFVASIALQQNGDKPDKISGVLVADSPLQADGAKAIYLDSFPITNAPTLAIVVSSADTTSPAPTIGATPTDSSASGATAVASSARPAAQPLLLVVLVSAFFGGLILNLMPCVLPVLSLKVFSLIRHASDDPRGAWKQGAAFTAGVVLSFWLLAGLLLFLRSTGQQLGWGFQMQNPGFVLALIYLFFLLGLNLLGVFEIGTSLVGLDAKVTSGSHGLTSSFLNGALATVAATPCTAPLMGWALGYAAQQPAIVSMLVFTALALGMASPYLLLTIFPAALKFVPKPGAWMESLKQFMGFLLLGTVIFLIYVFGALTVDSQLPPLLGALLLTGLAAWIYGKWNRPDRSLATKLVAGVTILALGALSLIWSSDLATEMPREVEARTAAATEGFKKWSESAVSEELAKGHPVFVDFTAAWCLSCKVNERVALGTTEVKQAFADRKVTLFKADWTHADPDISAALKKFNRDGVPLYLLYSPKNPHQPQVLPEVLTPGIVQDALKKL